MCYDAITLASQLEYTRKDSPGRILYDTPLNNTAAEFFQKTDLPKRENSQRWCALLDKIILTAFCVFGLGRESRLGRKRFGVVQGFSYSRDCFLWLTVGRFGLTRFLIRQPSSSDGRYFFSLSASVTPLGGLIFSRAPSNTNIAGLWHHFPAFTTTTQNLLIQVIDFSHETYVWEKPWHLALCCWLDSSRIPNADVQK